MAYVELPYDQLPEPYAPAWEDLKKSSSEAPFMEASFYLLREGTQWVGIIASLQPLAPLERNQAIVRGLLVRLTKLMRLTIRELVSKETFQQLSISRDAIETVATLLYLIGDDGTGARFDQYVMNSLIAERELLQDVEKNVKCHDGEVSPIEERIKRSIATTAKAAGIDDISKLPGRSKIGYPSAEQRIKLLGPDAYIGYRMGSVETHGDWNDLYRNHLTFEDGQFTPNLGGIDVRPQVPLMLIGLSFKVILENIGQVVPGEEVAQFLRPLFEDLLRRTRELDDLHEQFLQAR
jgi:Family of unknown function (DUF5677)